MDAKSISHNQPKKFWMFNPFPVFLWKTFGLEIHFLYTIQTENFEITVNCSSDPTKKFWLVECSWFSTPSIHPISLISLLTFLKPSTAEHTHRLPIPSIHPSNHFSSLTVLQHSNPSSLSIHPSNHISLLTLPVNKQENLRKMWECGCFIRNLTFCVTLKVPVFGFRSDTRNPKSGQSKTNSEVIYRNIEKPQNSQSNSRPTEKYSLVWKNAIEFQNFLREPTPRFCPTFIFRKRPSKFCFLQVFWICLNF